MAAWVRLVRVPQSLLSAVETELKSKGYPPLAWYDALLELRRAGADGLRPFELQGAMLLAQYNLSRLTDRLDKAGYVRRRPYDGDRRGQLLTITPQGERLLGSTAKPKAPSDHSHARKYSGGRAYELPATPRGLLRHLSPLLRSARDSMIDSSSLRCLCAQAPRSYRLFSE